MADPTARVREEGGSRAIVSWSEAAQRHAPAIAPGVGFWLAVYARFARHRGSVLAGGLAFFGVLSLVPAFLSLGALIALLYNPADFAEDLSQIIVDRPELADQLAPLLEQIASLADTSLTTIGVAGLVGLAVSLYAASRCVYVGRQVLDIAFELEPEPPSLLSRAAAIAVTLVAQVLVVAGVVAATLVPRLLDRLGIGDVYSASIRFIRLPLAVLIVYLVLTAAMRFGTRARRAVGWLNLGAVVGTLLILVGSLGLGWYLSWSATYSQVVAVLGGVVAVEIWLYVVGLAVVGSAEIEGVRLGFRRRDLATRS